MKTYSPYALLIALLLTPLVIWMFRVADRQIFEEYLSKRGRKLLWLEQDVSGWRWLSAPSNGGSHYVVVYGGKSGTLYALRCSLCFSSMVSLQRGAREWRAEKCAECRAHSQ